MGAVEDFASLLYAVPDYPAVTMGTNGCQCMDLTFEAIEDVMLAGYDYFKRLVIFIFANFAYSDIQLFRVAPLSRQCPLYSLDPKFAFPASRDRSGK
jgi:uncharacterized protein with von Willebrand factor type A (vWA) domain